MRQRRGRQSATAWALLYCAAAALVGRATAYYASTGPSIELPISKCTAKPIGCWSDCMGGPVGPASIRTLPIGVPGCCEVGQDPAGACPNCPKACVNALALKNTPNFVADVCPSAGHTCPTCVGGKLTPETCADFCAQMDPAYTIGGVEYGTQCYCGVEMNENSKLDDPDHKCDMPCPGNPAEKCGGGCAISVYEIECGSEWGWTLLLILLICTTLYLGGGTAYSYKAQGKKGVDALPHPEFWTTFRGLVEDGTAFFMQKVKAATENGFDGYAAVADVDAAPPKPAAAAAAAAAAALRQNKPAAAKSVAAAAAAEEEEEEDMFGAAEEDQQALQQPPGGSSSDDDLVE
jgi:hypothetical protein